MSRELAYSSGGYHAFGSLLPGRNYSSGSYRFGFNGQEKDDEINGATGTSYTAEFWQYDPRVARRWNIDPVDKPWMSSYHAFSNKPITNNDPNGACDDCPGKGSAMGAMAAPMNPVAAASAVAGAVETAIDRVTFLASSLWEGLTNGGEAVGRTLTGHPNPSGAFDNVGPAYGFSWANGFQPERAPMFSSDLPLEGNGGRLMGGVATLTTTPLMFGGPTPAKTATTVSNPVPSHVSRVVPGAGPHAMLGPQTTTGVEVFVTAADDIAGMNVRQMQRALTIQAPTQAQGGYTVYTFPTPSLIATAIVNGSRGFVGGGRTAGGAREFLIENGSVPTTANSQWFQW